MRREFIVPQEPRLPWKTLLPAFGGHHNSAEPNGQSTYHCFLARNAIYHGLAALSIKAGENILVPAFHCRAAIEPILAYGGEIKFYDVNLDLSPNFEDIEAKIDRKSRGILLIHYFGFPQPIKKWQELCTQHRLYLIEDCAHVLTGRTSDGIRLGEAGDITVFSWRKFLPLYDGGKLVINNVTATCNVKLEKGDFVFRLKAAKNTFDRLVETSFIGNCVSAVLALPSKVIRNWMLANGNRVRALKVNSYDVEFDPVTVNLQMTTFSKRILQNTDISTVVRKRRNNYEQLTHAVSAMTGVAPLFPILPEGICPWIFPTVVHAIKDLQPILRAKGIPVTSWSAVAHRLVPLEKFPNARFLYENLLFLPVHQSLKPKDLGTMIVILRETLNERVRMDQSRQVCENINANTSALLPPSPTQ
jgi:perosamine synthetase